jgi:hypothetical protein
MRAENASRQAALVDSDPLRAVSTLELESLSPLERHALFDLNAVQNLNDLPPLTRSRSYGSGGGRCTRPRRSPWPMVAPSPQKRPVRTEVGRRRPGPPTVPQQQVRAAKPEPQGSFLAPVTKARIVTAGLPHVGLRRTGMGWLPASSIEVSANSVAVGTTAEATQHAVLEVSRLEIDWSEWKAMTPHVRTAMRALVRNPDDERAVRKIQQTIRQQLRIADGDRAAPVVERDVAPGVDIAISESDAVALWWSSPGTCSACCGSTRT